MNRSATAWEVGFAESGNRSNSLNRYSQQTAFPRLNPRRMINRRMIG
jgi:hypothetical protein